MVSQAEKGKMFRALHQQSRAFVIPNPWDMGTARLLARLGFRALATTSAGYAFSVGQLDNTIGREAMLQHISSIASSTSLPLSGDLENGFGDAPATVAETIRLGADAGLSGGSIEDASGRPEQPIYEVGLAAERIRAAAEAARALPFPFTLTARAENYINGRPDLKDTIQRLQAYQEAGADVLYAPGLTTREQIATLIQSVDRPVNVLMGLPGASLNLATLEELGVRRVSVGSALARAALGAFLEACREMQSRGTFTFADSAVSFSEISELLEG